MGEFNIRSYWLLLLILLIITVLCALSINLS